MMFSILSMFVVLFAGFYYLNHIAGYVVTLHNHKECTRLFHVCYMDTLDAELYSIIKKVIKQAVISMILICLLMHGSIMLLMAVSESTIQTGGTLFASLVLIWIIANYTENEFVDVYDVCIEGVNCRIKELTNRKNIEEINPGLNYRVFQATLQLAFTKEQQKELMEYVGKETSQ